MKIFIQILALSLTLSFNSYSGSKQLTNEKKLSKEAIKLFKNKEYSKALNLFLELDKIAEESSEYDYMIGMCYLSTEEKNKALSYLISAANSNEVSFVVYYYLGRAYQIEKKYEEAIEAYQMYLDSLKSNNIIFVAENIENEETKVHIEKTPESVKGLIASCIAARKKEREEKVLGAIY